MTAALFLAASLASAQPAVETSTPTPKASLSAPEPPARDGRPIESAAELAADLSRSVAYLEKAQAFYTDYVKGGSRSKDENKVFLKVLEDYERELGRARKELGALTEWFKNKSDLK
jgi:hypothetical protein